MNPTTGIYCNGETLAPEPVSLDFSTDGQLTIQGQTLHQLVSLSKIRFSDRLGSVPRFLYLPDGGTIETADNAAIDAVLAQQKGGRIASLIHLLEQHSRVAAAATLLVVAAVALTIKFGLPALAAITAERLPTEIEAHAGQVALSTIARVVAPSQLSGKEHRAIQARLDRLIELRPQRIEVKARFCSLGAQYPNAFALPGGIIVLSDELIALADVDGELEAVLAHELGHLEYRHGMRSLLQNSFTLLLATVVTGDLSALSSVAGTIPFLILQNGYARQFEVEADAYAASLMDDAGIDRRHFASILKKLEASRPPEGVDFSYLSTHPNTTERVNAITAK
ncbi:MAG: M48 family metallopeptidase [Opitutaceae bacterium]|nr:M48 family metallopeptidase [Cephaloticoccus sp.]MCP5531432.1 M48 family metallopeptidase [Opitutaceae bacterium]